MILKPFKIDVLLSPRYSTSSLYTCTFIMSGYQWMWNIRWTYIGICKLALLVMYWLIIKSTNRWRVASWLGDDGWKHSLTKFAKTQKCFISFVKACVFAFGKRLHFYQKLLIERTYFFKFLYTLLITTNLFVGGINTLSSIKEYYSSHLTIATLVLMRFCNFFHKH